MKKVNHEQLGQLIELSYLKKSPLMIHGAPGIGKSDVVRAAAKKLGVEIIDVRLSQMESVDIRGLPVFNKETQTVVWYAPEWLPKTGNGILFFDEINLAPQSTHAACMELVLDRRLGSYELPENWQIMAAGNRTSDRAAITEMPAPLANRFNHIELEKPGLKEWTSWAIEKKVDFRIISFIQQNYSALFRFDEKITDHAFPTPRSVARCGILIKDIPSSNLPLLNIVASSAIGEGTAIEFETFVKLSNKIDVEELFNNPSMIKKITDISTKYSLLASIVDHYKHENEKPNADSERLAIQIINVCKNLEPEFSILLWRLCRSVDSEWHDKAWQSKEYEEWWKENEKYYDKT